MAGVMLLRSARWFSQKTFFSSVIPSTQDTVLASTGTAHCARRCMRSNEGAQSKFIPSGCACQSVEPATDHLTVRFDDGETLRYRKWALTRPR